MDYEVRSVRMFIKRKRMMKYQSNNLVFILNDLVSFHIGILSHCPG